VALVAGRGRQAEAPSIPTSALLPPGASSRLIITAPASGRNAEVRMFTEDGLFVRSFMAYPAGFRGGMTLATGDFDGNGRRSIVTGAGAGGSPHVRIFDGNTRVIGGFMAYDDRFVGGVRVATGDLDGDGIDEIVTGAGPGGGPHVRIFSARGRSLGGFFAADARLRRGVEVSVADVDGDGRNEILTRVPGAAGQVAWSPNGKVHIAAVGAGTPPRAPSPTPAARIATGAAVGQPPVVTLTDLAGKALFRFQAFESSFKGGVSAAVSE
jgi:hypothetical protein